VLSFYGCQDGQPYLRYVVEQNTFSMVLPATEDYIIQVVPRGGEPHSHVTPVPDSRPGKNTSPPVDS
jgi:hypothetical protein